MAYTLQWNLTHHCDLCYKWMPLQDLALSVLSQMCIKQMLHDSTYIRYLEESNLEKQKLE